MKKRVAETVYLIAVMVFIVICIRVNPNGKAVPGVAGEYEEAIMLTPPVTPENNVTVPSEITQEVQAEITPETEPTKAPVPTPEASITAEPEATSSAAPEPTPTLTPIVDKPEQTVIPIRNENYESYANEKKAWWFRRNTGHIPSGSGEDFPIAPYSAYYLNKNVTEDDKVMYLTFDCGYENGFTPAILDTLAEKNVKVMFFVTKDFIVKNPEYVKRMKAEGHLVGNHTVRHLSSPELTPEELEAELTEVAKTMLEKTGYQIDPFFRPPMGEYSERTLKVTQDMGYASIFWSIAYYDYDINNQPGKEYVVNHFAEYHHNGCIILMHNISESNTQALGEVIDLLRNEGYRMGELTELTK